MNKLWLTWFLLAVFSIVGVWYAQKAVSQTANIAQCDRNGVCLITEEMLDRVIAALEYWHKQAKTCKSS